MNRRVKLALAVVVLALCAAGHASASYIYDVHLNTGQDGLFGDVSFTEPTLLTTLTTVTTFDSNTLRAPTGDLATSVQISPLVGGPDCAVQPFLYGSAPCFAVDFAVSGSAALFAMLPDLTSPGVYGTPGHFSLAIHPASEPSPLTLLLIGLTACVCVRRRLMR